MGGVSICERYGGVCEEFSTGEELDYLEGFFEGGVSVWAAGGVDVGVVGLEVRDCCWEDGFNGVS